MNIELIAWMLILINLIVHIKKFFVKIILIIGLLFILTNNLNALENKIIIKINNEIITSHDLNNEKKYLILLNPNLIKLDEESISKAAKNSIIREKIKKLEIENNNMLINLKEKVLNSYIKNLYSRINLKSINEFEEFLSRKNLNINFIKNKISIEILWNNLIYNKYSSSVKINKDELKNKLMNSENKYVESYNLNEIIFSYNSKDNLNKKYNEIKKDIEQKGFSSAALIHSISDTNKDGGSLGWINQKSISKKIFNEIKLLNDGEYSKPIIIPGGALILKLNEIERKEVNLDIEKELTKMVEIEKNNQLNQFSNLYFNKIKKNIIIDEI